MDNNKVWMPKEIKQKDVIVGEIPYIRRPITTRHLIYFFPSVGISLIIFFSFASMKSILLQLAMFCLMFPFAVTMLLNSPKNGKYVEEIIRIKLKHRSRSGIILNEKSAVTKRRNKNV